MKNIEYKHRTIYKLFPSGYYEVYSYTDQRFMKFDDLDNAKSVVDEDEENGY